MINKKGGISYGARLTEIKDWQNRACFLCLLLTLAIPLFRESGYSENPASHRRCNRVFPPVRLFLPLEYGLRPIDASLLF